jgi:hypothetical protein
MTFSKTHRKCVGILAAAATCAAIAAPTASAIPYGSQPHPPASIEIAQGSEATLTSQVPGGNGPVGEFPTQSVAPNGVVVRFDGLPTGTVGATSGLLSRPAPGDRVAQTPEFPPISGLEQFRFVPVAAPVVSPTQAYDDAYESLQRFVPLPAVVAEFGKDAPRTAPDALVRPTEQLPVAEPGFDWTDAGVGIAIGAIAGLMLGAALLVGRRRGTLAGA